MAKKESRTSTTGGSGRKKLFLLLLAGVVVIGTAGWFVLRPTPEPAPQPGEVVTLDPLQVNLAAGHYLRVALALQMTTEVAEEVDGSRAMDAVIDHYSGKPVAAVTEPQRRAELKSELKEKVLKLYGGELIDVYFTEFVTQ